MKQLVVLVAFVSLVGCIPVIVPPQTAPPFIPPPVVEPPVPQPPVVEPEPEPPTVNLNVWVLTPASNPIVGAKVKLGSDERITDGGGFVNFGVKGQVTVEVSAKDYAGQTVSLPPGDHRIHLVSTLPPPPVVVPPVVVPPQSVDSCKADVMRVSDGCLRAVAEASPNYKTCNATGDGAACHRYTREVARALRTAQTNPRWGLITKSRGEQACTTVRCGRNVDGGYGEDMVAYLPESFPMDAQTNKWCGLDIVAGAGAPGARFQGGPLGCGEARPTNLWAPIP